MTAFLNAEGIPVFRSGSTTNGLDAFGGPVFGLPAAGTNQSISVPAAAIVVAAQTPTVVRTARQTIAVPAAAIAVAGQTPTVARTARQSIAVPAAAVVVAGQIPTVTRTTNGPTVNVPAAAIAVAGQTPTIARTVNNYISVPSAAILLNAFAPQILVGGVVVGPTPGQGGAGGKGGGRKRRRTVVEIDGKTYNVNNVEEAQELLTRAQTEAVTVAPRAAKTALNKARKVESKTGKWPTLELAVPEVATRGEPDPEIAAMVEAAQRGIDEIYLRAAHEQELVLRTRREFYKQQEDEVIEALKIDDEEEEAMVEELVKLVSARLKKAH